MKDNGDTYEVKNAEMGYEYAIVVYANNFNSTTESTLPQNQRYSCPVARFNCYFSEQSHPVLWESVSVHRTLQHLEDNYIKVGHITFDDYEGMNFDDPKQPYIEGRSDNNSWDKPLPWGESYYGFTYPQLKTRSNDGDYKWLGYSPMHGDYVLVKSANYGTASPGKMALAPPLIMVTNGGIAISPLTFCTIAPGMKPTGSATAIFFMWMLQTKHDHCLSEI